MRMCIELILQSCVAIGTVGTLIASVYQIWREKHLRSKQEKAAQAIRVAAWFEDVAIKARKPGNQNAAYRTVLIRNDNLTPIYDVVITIVGLYGAGPHERGEDNSDDSACRIRIPQLATGLWGAWIAAPGGAMGVVCTLEIAFRDSAGISWIRRGNGELVEIRKNPLVYYSIMLPAPWNDVERLGA